LPRRKDDGGKAIAAGLRERGNGVLKGIAKTRVEIESGVPTVRRVKMRVAQDRRERRVVWNSGSINSSGG
jgi:hypothetical protein